MLKPDLTARFVARVDGQHAAVNDQRRAPSGGGDKVGVHLEKGAVAQKPFVKRIGWKFAHSLELFVPFPCLSRNMFLS